MSYYSIQQGDCLASIASRHGFADWRTIYDHPNNAEFKNKRPNPNLIYPGDVLYIPEKLEKTVAATTGNLHRFTVKRATTRLRIALVDLGDRPMSGVTFTLSVGGTVRKGITDAGGFIDEPIPADAAQGTLTLDDHGITKSLLLGSLDPIDAISGVQGRLKNLGYDCGPVDGIEGPMTRAAVRSFQRDNPPLVVDGICGPKTRAALLDRYGC